MSFHQDLASKKAECFTTVNALFQNNLKLRWRKWFSITLVNIIMPHSVCFWTTSFMRNILSVMDKPDDMVLQEYETFRHITSDYTHKKS